ncbi:Histone deacetylase 15, variant 3 [Lathyrus oleraceus]|uniref:Histone deacetylase 15, variant 3 n=1 Tax=Pisum sativum TaxID=3888 RepID=A0A9D5AS27_PEA|nr:Histone deacetylase 15, variant 3 [Pisum sativum]
MGAPFSLLTLWFLCYWFHCGIVGEAVTYALMCSRGSLSLSMTMRDVSLKFSGTCASQISLGRGWGDLGSPRPQVDCRRVAVVGDAKLVDKQTKKRRRILVPKWWKWGRRSFLFRMLNSHRRVKSKRLC